VARCLGVLRMIQAVLPAWRKRGSGVIVNVSSGNGRVSSPLRAAYSASKFALEAFTESLHLEVRHFGIRCVLIESGIIATGITASEPHQGPADYPDFGSCVSRRVARRLRLGCDGGAALRLGVHSQ
jgi:NAD(P)-dependent dehydrogenase (short-subunit alcohol dehydrogenase family)